MIQWYAMIQRFEAVGVTWVDVSSPNPEEIRAIMEEYNLPPELLGDLSGPVPRSEAVSAKSAIKITLDFPMVRRKDVESAHEIKFIITKQTLLTVRYEEDASLHKFGKEFEVLSTLKRATKETHGGFLFVALMSALYDGLTSKLDYIESRLTFIEQEMFEERERQMVFDISRTSQTLITFRQILFSHKEVLEVAEPFFLKMFEEGFDRHTQELVTYYQYLSRRVVTLSASLQELRNTNDSLLSAKQNQTMKVLTIMAFVTYPLTLVSSIFSMNTNATPIIGHPYDFWIVIGIMAAIAIVFFSYFKYKRWF